MLGKGTILWKNVLVKPHMIIPLEAATFGKHILPRKLIAAKFENSTHVLLVYQVSWMFKLM